MWNTSKKGCENGQGSCFNQCSDDNSYRVQCADATKGSVPCANCSCCPDKCLASLGNYTPIGPKGVTSCGWCYTPAPLCPIGTEWDGVLKGCEPFSECYKGGYYNKGCKHCCVRSIIPTPVPSPSTQPKYKMVFNNRTGCFTMKKV